ncbi:hypothetical protein TNCV_3122031 [Trichonephila clavipes]|nr:hypothetical protein TNCV_3122031 [Trichonephila clavipes]
MREPTNSGLILDNFTPRPNEAINSCKEKCSRLERAVDHLRHGRQEVQTFAVINQSLPAAKVSSESLICKSFLLRELFSSGSITAERNVTYDLMASANEQFRSRRK